MSLCETDPYVLDKSSHRATKKFTIDGLGQSQNFFKLLTEENSKGKTLEDEIQGKLREKLKFLDDRQLIEQAGQVVNPKKQQNVPWP